MTVKEFLKLVEEMRHAQKEYIRIDGDVRVCRRLEKRVDLACRKLRDGQKDLFEAME